MSLLDQLEQQAKQRKEQEERQQAVKDELTAYYRSYTAPLMRQLFTYLKKLTEHLTFLKESQTVTYDIPHIGLVEAQVEPRFDTLFSEVDERLEILVMGKAQIAKQRKVNVNAEGRQVEIIESMLRERGLRGERQARKNASGEIVSATYWIHGEIIRKGAIVASQETREVTFNFVNFDILGNHKRVLKGENLGDEAMLDRLGRFIAGRDREFFHEQISANSREQISQHLRKEQESKKLELLEHEIQQLEKQERAEASLKGRMKQQLRDLRKRLLK